MFRDVLQIYFRGLDSSTCFQLISLLKALARGGRTVICVIHQPNSSLFDMFDHLYMLAEGRCIYQGQTSNLAHFVTSTVGIECPSYHSPADFGELSSIIVSKISYIIRNYWITSLTVAIDVATGKYGYVIDKLAEEVNNANPDKVMLRKKRQSIASPPTPDILSRVQNYYPHVDSNHT